MEGRCGNGVWGEIGAGLDEIEFLHYFSAILRCTRVLREKIGASEVMEQGTMVENKGGRLWNVRC